MEDEDSMTFTGRMGTDVKPQNVVWLLHVAKTDDWWRKAESLGFAACNLWYKPFFFVVPAFYDFKERPKNLEYSKGVHRA